MKNPTYERELTRLKPEHHSFYNRGWLARTNQTELEPKAFALFPGGTESEKLAWQRGWVKADSTPVLYWTTVKRIILNGRHPTVYFASRVKHAQKWIDLRKSGLDVISTWIDFLDEEDSYSVLAQNCIREPLAADVTVLYSEPGDELKYALVEVGAALAGGHLVIVVGTGPSISSTMLAHPNVKQVETLTHALELLSSFAQ